MDPKTAEAWKRRGQARAAIGETAEVYFILHSITVIVLEAFVDKMFLSKFMKSYVKVVGFPLQALEDLTKAIKLEPTPDLLHERGIIVGLETRPSYLVVWVGDISLLVHKLYLCRRRLM